MEKITVYEKPTCTTCRKVAKILTENGVNFEKVNYYIGHFSKSLLKKLLKKINMKSEERLRKNEVAFKEPEIANKKYTSDEILDLIIENPDLVQRPIVEKGDRAILARPAEKINELI
jgi:arsenate reductase (glutaredoxin)